MKNNQSFITIDGSVKAEASIFWSKIADNLPKSMEREALGDEKIYRAFYPAYVEFREYLIKTQKERLIKEVSGMKKKHDGSCPAGKWWRCECGFKENQYDGYNLALEDILRRLQSV